MYNLYRTSEGDYATVLLQKTTESHKRISKYYKDLSGENYMVPVNKEDIKNAIKVYEDNINGLSDKIALYNLIIERLKEIDIKKGEILFKKFNNL